MARFEKGNKQGRGRPLGSRNRVASLPTTLTKKALEKLTEAVEAGESWACQEVLKRVYPALKPITPHNSLDGELLTERVKEIREFENRLVVLEQASEH